ncbi:MAG: PAS domain-containing sensor histidine kinase [Phycisphaerae bacterium]
MRIPHRFMLTLLVASFGLLMLTGFRHWYTLGAAGATVDEERVRVSLKSKSPDMAQEDIEAVLDVIRSSTQTDAEADTFIAVVENAASLFALMITVLIAAHLFIMKPIRSVASNLARDSRTRWMPPSSLLSSASGRIGIDHAALLRGEPVGIPDDARNRLYDLATLAERRMEEIELLDKLLTLVPAVAFRCIANEQQRILYMSDSMESLFGHPTGHASTKEWIGWRDLIHPDDQQWVMEKRRDSVEAGENYVIDYRVRHGDGSTRWVRERGRPRPQEESLPPSLDGLFFDITERRVLEKKLKETERRYRGFIASNVAGIWRYTLRKPMPLSLSEDEQVEWLMREAIISEVNDVFAEWHGFKRKEDVIGLTLEEMREQYQDSSESILRNWIESGYGWERHVIKEKMRDGTVRSFLTLGHSVFENGCMTEAWGTQIDISDRLDAEEELQRTRALLEAAIEASPAGVVIADAPDVRIRMANSAALGIRGADQKHRLTDIPYESHPSQWQLLHPDGTPWNGADLPLSRAVLEGKTFSNIEMIMVQGTNDHRCILVNAAPVRNAKGEIIAGVAVFPDITERKQADEETRRLRALFNNIIDSMPSVLIGVDQKGRVTHWNRQAEQFSGQPSTEAQGRFIGEAYEPLHSVYRRIEKAIEGGTVYRENDKFALPNGDVRPVDITIYPLLADGVQGAVLRIDDATERIRLQEILVQSEKMLSVAGLAAGMAHEINNPIGAVLLGVENILRRTSIDLEKNREVADQSGVNLNAMNRYLDSRKVFQMLSDIRESGARAAKIVSNMLQFSRKSDSKMGSVYLPSIINNSIDLAMNDYGMAKRRNFRSVQLEKDFESDFPMVDCASTEIEQVMLNLLKNSAEAMFEAGMAEPGHQPRPTIKITLRHRNPYAVIIVEDNGPGMDEDVRIRAFEPFFTTKEPGLGTGLGLAVSYMIITNNHRGTLHLDSSPGGGTRFTIRIPVEQATDKMAREFIHQGDTV